MALQNAFEWLATESKQDSLILTQAELLALLQSVTIVGTSEGTDKSINIQPKESETWAWSFAKVLASGVDTENGAIVGSVGAGMTVRQLAGNIEILSGTTAYSETIIRSVPAFNWRFRFEYSLMLSQRIANHNVAIELTDVLWDGLSFTINSTTSVTVTKVAHGLTAENIGNGVWIGKCSVASCLTQRAVIASIPSVDTITLTVVDFPASGTGTCSLFGLNYHQIIYNRTSATTLGTGYTTQRKGWQNAFTNATINTTASPGHVWVIDATKPFDATYSDQVPGTATGVQNTPRATVNQNTPPDEAQLYIQIRVWNASTAPASTTTATIGFVRVEKSNPLQVALASVQPLGFKNALPVSVQNTVSAAVTTTTNIPSTAQGSSTNAQYISAATTNATSVKTSVGTINHLTISNNGATGRYFKLYNKASAPTVGTDTPVHTIFVPPNSTVIFPCWPFWLRLATGIAFAVTWGIAVADTTVIVANEIVVNISYT